MSTRLAQTLFATMTRGMSLREWERSGLLYREWALYERVARDYERVVVISHGDDDDQTMASLLNPRPIVIANRDHLPVLDYLASLPARIEEALGPVESAVVRTNQMDDAGAACTIAGWLRHQGTACALIARCGYLRSQFLAAEFGPGSPQAADAALIERTVIGMADLVVGTTERIVSDLAWRDGLSDEQVRVVPNYVLDDACILPDASRQPGLLVCVGQLVPRKRVDHLVRAVAELHHDHDVTLHVIGSGPEEGPLRALAAELGAPVTFFPRLPHHEVLDRMRRASVYLQASALEGHPKTLMEAMACGAACIVADSPGLGNLIQNGVTGLCVSGEPQAFAYALAGLLEDACWREQLGACASQFARTHFGLDRVIELEREAHRAALQLAAHRPRSNNTLIRWCPALLHRQPEEIAGAWAEAMEALLARLPTERRAQLRNELARRDLAA
ncbi:MAG: glycosyltransferase family 4 protein [Phycisphaerales bacterium]|nr:glycosyltransferase family 4 protein [Phycisphaerales bacterium]